MKKTTYNNYRVEVLPDDRYSHLDTKAICEHIKYEITRHVDNVSTAQVIFDTVETCEYCGYKWSEIGSKYNGGCCEKDEEDHQRRLKQEI